MQIKNINELNDITNLNNIIKPTLNLQMIERRDTITKHLPIKYLHLCRHINLIMFILYKYYIFFRNSFKEC